MMDDKFREGTSSSFGSSESPSVRIESQKISDKGGSSSSTTTSSSSKPSLSKMKVTATAVDSKTESEVVVNDPFSELTNHKQLLGAYLIDQNTSRYYSLSHLQRPMQKTLAGSSKSISSTSISKSLNYNNENPFSYSNPKNCNISEEDLELQVFQRKAILDEYVPTFPEGIFSDLYKIEDIDGNSNENDKGSGKRKWKWKWKRGEKIYEKIKRSRCYSSQWDKALGIFLVFAGIFGLAICFTTKAILDLRHKDKGLSKHIYGTLKAARPLIDPDTPYEFFTKNSSDGSEWKLVFSDEFNAEGRSFYNGDDAFWEAVDLHYAATENKEWYSPDMITTSNGCLKITLDDRKSHNLNYTSGMLQGWNRMCFTQGILEASIKMPGSYEARGLWPAFWTLGNLGRAGYMATTEGVWPYSYDTCDAGITANQSSNDGMSYLPGQRLNSCVCPGEDHPSIGIGRGAPEIDVLEGYHNVLSQTYNFAPFDNWKMPDYEFMIINNKSITAMNRVYGSQYQEMVSALTTSNETWFDEIPEYVKDPYYKNEFGRFQRFAMEYRSDNEDNSKNYIKFFIGEEKTFEIYGSAFHPDGNINWRMIPKEPLYIILNLGLSESWSDIDYNSFKLPAYLEIDYVRLYQPEDKISVTCNPGLYNTTDYISRHPNAYFNPNMTTWEMAGYKNPLNSLFGCKSS